MPTGHPAFKGIKDVFYETRVLMGRDYTLRRFAEEVLGKSIDPVMLGYIEKGKRFPSEALVRRLAAVRKQDAHELLAILWRDRTVHAFAKELRRVLHAPRSVSGIEDGELAVLVTQAIAALPDDGAWVPISEWHRAMRAVPPRQRRKAKVGTELVARVETILRERDLIQSRGGKVRKRERHFVAGDETERRALALEFCALFAKGLLDKLALGDRDTGTYLRNHYLHIAPERAAEFQVRLDEMLRKLTQEFAGSPSADARFLNVLVSSTTI